MNHGAAAPRPTLHFVTGHWSFPRRGSRDGRLRGGSGKRRGGVAAERLAAESGAAEK